VTTVLIACYIDPAEGLERSLLETLAGGRQLRDKLGEASLRAVLLGADLNGYAEKLIQSGADEALVVDHPRLKNAEADILVGVLEQVARRLLPDVILFPNSLVGEQVAPRLAYRLGAGIITDCTGFEIKEGAGSKQIRWLRPVYGGKAMAYMVANGPLQIATIRSRAFEPLPPDPARQGRVQPMDIDVDSLPCRVSLVQKIQEAQEGISLDQAEIVVSGGRGMGGPEGFAELRKLADCLKAGLAGSRPAADSGWVPHSRLVGQTGKIVAPQLYIAVGISGAPQHMAGAGSSKLIVAINKDEEAPIFKQAHVGVIGEWQQVIPAFYKACERIVEARKST